MRFFPSFFGDNPFGIGPIVRHSRPLTAASFLAAKAREGMTRLKRPQRAEGERGSTIADHRAGEDL